jgi:hypothetical protein
LDVEAIKVWSPCQYLLPPLQFKQGSTGNFRELAADTIFIKTIKEQCQKRGGSVLYCTSSSSKERSLLQPYIVIDNNQEHSNEELVMYSCLWRKAAVGSNINQQSVKKSIDQ